MYLERYLREGSVCQFTGASYNLCLCISSSRIQGYTVEYKVIQ